MKYSALWLAYEYCLEKGIYIPSALKTQEYYHSVINRLVRNLYRGYTDALEFVMLFEDLITGQLTRAWKEGMAENGVEEIDEDAQAELDGIIASEISHVGDFADEIDAAGRLTGEPIDPYLDRVSLWASRYEDVRNQAILYTADEKTKLIWIYGDTQHCTTCAALNGIVAYAREWDMFPFRPQNPKNDYLECGGWRCQCELIPTDNRHTIGAIDKLQEIYDSLGAE